MTFDLRFAIGFSALLVVVEARPIRAQGSDTRTQALAKMEEGSAHLRRRDFSRALECFDEAFATYPSPKVHFNRGLALRGLGRHADAADAFGRFLHEAEDASEEPRAQAREMLAALRPKVAWLAIDSQAVGAQVLVDGRPRGTVPLPQALAVSPGSHQVVLSAGAMRSQAEVVAAAGATVNVRLGLPVKPAPSLPEAVARQTAEPPIYKRWWFWSVVAGVAAGTAAVMLVDRKEGLARGTLGELDLR